MARVLKVFKTHIGFYDLVVAAPSMKAAAAAWEAHPRLFAQGFAAVTNEPDAVKAALEQPGIVLRRPHGQAGPYKAQPDKPAVPKLSARQKEKAKQSRRQHEAEQHKAEAAAKKRKKAAERRAKAAAQDELADIEQEEARLRQRRQALQKKFHLRSV